MGYAFRATRVAVAEGSAASTVDVTVTVEQVGLAPFYYPLGLTLNCPGGGWHGAPLPGVETLVARGDAGSFTFAGLPATARCLDGVSISLASGFAYLSNPIRFAQGADGRTIEVALPLPPRPAPPTADPTAPPTLSGDDDDDADDDDADDGDNDDDDEECEWCSDEPSPWMERKDMECDDAPGRLLEKKCRRNNRWKREEFCTFTCYVHESGYDDITVAMMLKKRLSKNLSY